VSITAREKMSVGVMQEDNFFLTMIDNGKVYQEVFEETQMLKIINKSKYVITGLHGQDIIYKNIELPSSIEKKKIKESIKWQFYDIEADDYEFLYRKIKSDENSIRFLCAAVPKKMFNEFIEKNSGIYTGLDLKPFAAWRGYKASNPVNEPVILVLRGLETITIIGGNENLEYVREFSSSLNIELETKRTIDHFRQSFGFPDAKIEDLTQEQSAWTITYGYAVAYLDPQFINILPERHRRVRAKGFKKPRKIEIVAAIAVFFLIASCMPYWLARNLEKETEGIERSIQKLTPIVNEVNNTQRQINKYQEYLNALTTHETIRHVPIINDIRSVLPPEVALVNLKLIESSSNPDPRPANNKDPNNKSPDNKNPKSKEIESQGTGSFTSYRINHISMSAKSLGIKPMGLLLDNMTQIPYLENVELKNIVQKSPGYYTFDISADIKY
jgi:hypothetical protein